MKIKIIKKYCYPRVGIVKTKTTMKLVMLFLTNTEPLNTQKLSLGYSLVKYSGKFYGNY